MRRHDVEQIPVARAPVRPGLPHVDPRRPGEEDRPRDREHKEQTGESSGALPFEGGAEPLLRFVQMAKE